MFSKKELERFRKLALDAIIGKTATGFNFYPNSIELQMPNISVPVKCGHRSTKFIGLLERAVLSEFPRVSMIECPRTTIYQWLKGYKFPLEEETRIYDIEKNRYIQNEADYANASDKLIAESSEYTLVFSTDRKNLVSVVKTT